jgi:iron complex outermembrane receptor protein
MYVESNQVRYLPWDHTSFYLTLAQGFKSGGFAAGPQTIRQTEPLDQEEAISVEIGVKSEPLSNLRVTAALYSVEYEGLQIQNFGPDPNAPEAFGVFRTFNAGDAEATGLEVEVEWLPTDNMSLSGYISYTDSEFGETKIENAGANGNQDGQDLLRTPELQYGVNFEYVTPFTGGSNLRFNFDYYFSDDERGTLPTYGIQYAYNLIDASVAWTSASGNIEFLLWGKNIADEEYLTHIYTIAGSVTGVYGDPRTYGLTATFKF